MNREIKFRGKRKDNGEWVYGDLVQIENDAYIYDYDISDNGVSDVPRLSQIKWHVDPATVGQYIGLRDCKRTEEYPEGQEIYGEDILGYEGKPEGVVRFGEWNCTCCDGIYGFYLDGNDLRYHDNIYEVVGNIHDHPELLK